jgi:hypothetical protein
MASNGLAHIAEGTAVHDGTTRQLYDPADTASAEAVLFQQCVNYSVGPLTISACIDTSVPSVSVTITLLGATLASCTLAPDNPGCQIGGSVDGFTAEVTLSLDQNPWAITIQGELCAPIVGCKTFSVTIPFG